MPFVPIGVNGILRCGAVAYGAQKQKNRKRAKFASS